MSRLGVSHSTYSATNGERRGREEREPRRKTRVAQIGLTTHPRVGCDNVTCAVRMGTPLRAALALAFNLPVGDSFCPFCLHIHWYNIIARLSKLLLINTRHFIYTVVGMLRHFPSRKAQLRRSRSQNHTISYVRRYYTWHFSAV